MKISKSDLKTIVTQRLASLLGDKANTKNRHKYITESRLKEVVTERLTKLLSESRPIARDLRTGKVSKWSAHDPEKARRGRPMTAAEELLAMVDYADFGTEEMQRRLKSAGWEFGLSNSDHKKAKQALANWRDVAEFGQDFDLDPSNRTEYLAKKATEEYWGRVKKLTRLYEQQLAKYYLDNPIDIKSKRAMVKAGISLEKRIKRMAFDRAIIIADAEWFKQNFSKINIPAQPRFFDLLKQEASWKYREMVGTKKTGPGWLSGEGDKLKDLEMTRDRLIKWLAGLRELPKSSKTKEARKNLLLRVITGETAAALENKTDRITSEDVNNTKKTIHDFEKENGFKRGEIWDEVYHDLKDEFTVFKETRGERRRRKTPTRGTTQKRKLPRKEKTIGMRGKWNPVQRREFSRYGMPRSIWGPGGGLADQFRIFALLRSMGDPVILSDDLWNNVFGPGQVWGLDLQAGGQMRGPGVFGKFPSGRGLPEEIIEDLNYFKDNILKTSKVTERMNRLPPLNTLVNNLKQTLYPGVIYDDKQTELLQKELAKEAKKMIDRYSLGISSKGRSPATSVYIDDRGIVQFLNKDGKLREKDLSRAQKRVSGKSIPEIESDLEKLYKKSLENFTTKEFIDTLPKEGNHLHKPVSLEHTKGSRIPEDYNLKVKGGEGVMPKNSSKLGWKEWYLGYSYNPIDTSIVGIENAKEAGRFEYDRRMGANAVELDPGRAINRGPGVSQKLTDSVYFGQGELGRKFNDLRYGNNYRNLARFRKTDMRLNDGTFIYLEDFNRIKSGEAILVGEYGKRFVFPIKIPGVRVRPDSFVGSSGEVIGKTYDPAHSSGWISRLVSDNNLKDASPVQRARIRTSIIIGANAVEGVAMPLGPEGRGSVNMGKYNPNPIAIKNNGTSMSRLQINQIKRHMLKVNPGGWKKIEKRSLVWLDKGIPQYIKDQWADYQGYFAEEGERIRHLGDRTHSGKPVSRNLMDQYRLEKEILTRKAFTDAILDYEKSWLKINFERRSVVLGGRSKAEELIKYRREVKKGRKFNPPTGPAKGPADDFAVGGWRKRTGYSTAIRWVLLDQDYIKMLEHMRANPGERVFIPQIVRDYWTQIRFYPTGRELPKQIITDIGTIVWDYVQSVEYALSESFRERWGGGRFGKQWKDDRLWKEYVARGMPGGLGASNFGTQMAKTDEDGRAIKDKKGKTVWRTVSVNEEGKAARLRMLLGPQNRRGQPGIPGLEPWNPSDPLALPAPKEPGVGRSTIDPKSFSPQEAAKAEKWIKSSLWKKLNPGKSNTRGGVFGNQSEWYIKRLKEMHADLIIKGVPQAAADIVVSSKRPFTLMDEQILDNLLDDKLTKKIKMSNYKNMLQQQMSPYIESGQITVKQAQKLASKITNEAWEKGLNQYMIQTNIGMQKEIQDWKHVDEIVKKINNSTNVPAPVKKAMSGVGKTIPPAMVALIGYAIWDIWSDEKANYSDDETIAEKMRQTMIVVDPTMFGVQTVSGFSDILFEDNPDWKIMDWKNLIPGHIALSRLGSLREPAAAERKSREHAQAFASGIETGRGYRPWWMAKHDKYGGAAPGTLEFCMGSPEDEWCKENAPVMWLEFCYQYPDSPNCKKNRDKIKNFKQEIFDKFMDPIKEKALEEIVGEPFKLPENICNNVKGKTQEQKQKECNRLKKLAYQEYLMKGVYKLIASDKKLNPKQAFQKLMGEWKKATLQKCKDIPGSPCGPDNNMSPHVDWDAREAAKKAPEPTVELGSGEEFDMTFIPDPMKPKDRNK